MIFRMDGTALPDGLLSDSVQVDTKAIVRMRISTSENFMPTTFVDVLYSNGATERYSLSPDKAADFEWAWKLSHE